MRTHQAAAQMLEAENNLKQGVYDEDTPCMALVRVGTPTQKVVSGPLKQFLTLDLGEPLHSFVVCGEMHHIEEDMYKYHMYKEGMEGVTLIRDKDSQEEEKKQESEDD